MRRGLQSKARKGRGCARDCPPIGKAFVAKHQLAIYRPVGQKPVQPDQVGHMWHIGAAALLGRFNGMGLQPVLTDTFGIREIGLHRDDARSPHFGSLFHDEIGAGFLDRGKQKPQVGRHPQGFCLRLADQRATALARLGHTCKPFTVTSVEQKHPCPFGQAHHPEQVMRLIPVQRNGLPRTKGMVYIEADFRISHEADNMTAQDEMPEGSIAQTGQVADAVQGNWVDRLAPPATRPYLRLSRADRPIGTWLLLLPCWWGLALAILHDGQARLFDLWIFIGCALGAFLMRGAGCTWNDITDRDFDGAVARTRSRPIPSGQVSMKQAAGWMVAQALIALCILLTFNTAAILLGIIALLPVAIYPFAKRFTWWPQVFLGLAFNWGALLAWTAHAGSLGWPAVILYITGIAWTLFYDTIYAHQDTEDDALIGVKSTARLFGQASPQWLTGFMYATTLLMIVAVLAATRAAGAGILPTVVAICGPLAMLVHMRWQMTRFDPTDMLGLLRLFRSNRDAGLLPLLFFAGAALV